jgi:hypothetical protein
MAPVRWAQRRRAGRDEDRLRGQLDPFSTAFFPAGEGQAEATLSLDEAQLHKNMSLRRGKRV